MNVDDVIYPKRREKKRWKAKDLTRRRRASKMMGLVESEKRIIKWSSKNECIVC